MPVFGGFDSHSLSPADRPVDDTSSSVPIEPERPPSVDRLMRAAAFTQLVARYGREATLTQMRAALAALRAGNVPWDADGFAARCAAALEALHTPSLRRVFNLTGTILHTNLGRAILPAEACEAVQRVMAHPTNLEFDLARRERGERDDHVEGLVCRLTGAEAATIVNNNAAAVLILLNTFAAGREVLVSRGELVEIGGSFRIPDVMQRAGAVLREVGTTNRTHLRDFAGAIGLQSAVILKVHTSNYRIEGFTSAVPAADLAALARDRDVVFAEDLGSGTLVDLSRWSLPREPTVQESLAAADLVTFSGDKLLGGVQCGIIAGRRTLVEKIRRNPLKRALRVDKIVLAAMEAVLRLYLDPDRLAERLPTLRLLTRPQAEIRAAAERLRPALAAALGERAQASVADCKSQIGSGALPLATLPSAALVIAVPKGPGGGARLEAVVAAFMRLPVPVVGRVENGALWLDVRALGDERVFAEQLTSLSSDPR